MSKQIHISINDARCKQCGICSALCPAHVFEQTPGQTPSAVHMEHCIGCKLCEMRCPDFAIDVEVE